MASTTDPSRSLTLAVLLPNRMLALRWAAPLNRDYVTENSGCGGDLFPGVAARRELVVEHLQKFGDAVECNHGEDSRSACISGREQEQHQWNRDYRIELDHGVKPEIVREFPIKDGCGAPREQS